MSMRFRYQLVRMPRPVVPLNGRFVRPRPLVWFGLTGPLGTFTEVGHLDSGADDCVFPDRVAAKVGINLTNAPLGQASVVGGATLPVRYAQAWLRLSDGRESREWPAWVAFTTAPVGNPLLGFAGCLQFFDAQFFGGREEVELSVNGLYPGI